MENAFNREEFDRLAGEFLYVITYMICRDGESNEGQIWEAAMFAGHNKLGNLIAITDFNKLQIDGLTDEVMTLEPLADRWRAFNWEVFEMNGHDWDDIHATLLQAREIQDKPVMIIAHTIKARDCALFENKPESHNIKVDNAEVHAKCMAALKHTGYQLPY